MFAKMKSAVLLTILVSVFSMVPGPAAAQAPGLEKYRATIQDPNIQLIQGALRRLRATAARAGGNVSGGGEDFVELSIQDVLNDGAELQKFQLGLLGLQSAQAHTPNQTPNPSLDPSIDVLPSAQTKLQHRIAIIDSGLSETSRAVRNVVHFQDFTNRCPDKKMCDESLHGTLVADLIAQAAPESELVVLKALNGTANGDFKNVIAAMKWILKNHKRHGIKIINLSLVSPDHLSGFWNDVDTAKELLTELKIEGLFIVTAAGNDSKKSVQVFPADSAAAITVGSFTHYFSRDPNDYVSSPFNNFGYASKSEVKHTKFLFYENVSRNFNAWVFKPDLLAPGDRVFTCATQEKCYLATGSSFAAALVSGGIRNLLLKNPALTPEDFLKTNRAACPSPSITGSFDGTKACAARFDLSP